MKLRKTVKVESIMRLVREWKDELEIARGEGDIDAIKEAKCVLETLGTVLISAIPECSQGEYASCLAYICETVSADV